MIRGSLRRPALLGRARNLFPYRGAHAPHEKTAVQYHKYRTVPLNAAQSRDRGIPHAGFFAQFFQLCTIAWEMQRVRGSKARIQLPERARIQNLPQAGICPHRAVISAQRTHHPQRIPALCRTFSAAFGTLQLPAGRQAPFPHSLIRQHPCAPLFK